MGILYCENPLLERGLRVLDPTGQLLKQHVDIKHLHVVAVGNDDVTSVLFLLVLLWDERGPN